MILLALFATPQTKDPLRIDVIERKGLTETILAKPTEDGFALSTVVRKNEVKLMTIGHQTSETSFIVSGHESAIDLKEFFPAFSINDFATSSTAELKAKDGGVFKVTRSGGTVYVTDPTGTTIGIHK